MQSGETTTFTFSYNISYYTTSEQETEMDTFARNFVGSDAIKKAATTYDKVKAIYDWLCTNVVYDHRNLNDHAYMLKHTAYAAAINHTAVCQGYAVLFYRLALECVEAGADKVRINPGNIGGADRVKAVARACARRNIPIRIGVNGGSLEKPILAKYGGVTPQAMVDSAFGHIALLNRYDFDDICVSLKSSSVPITMGAYELMHQQADYPLHLGVTEAGTTRMGTLKSAAGIGGLLALGIGDTFRVTLTADPVEEVYAARDILKAIGLRREGPDLIACPTCGRTKIDLIPLAQAVEERLKTVTKPITVAVMGCPVNGPGEAAAADVGIAGGNGKGILFRHGEVVRQVPQEELLDALMALIEEL